VRQLLKDYQNSLLVRDDKIVKKDSVVEEKITKEVMNVVNGVINNWHFYLFENYDDLLQHAMFNCYKNYAKFSPSKGTAFNFFTKIAYISLLNYTTRKKKHRQHSDVDEQVHLEARSNQNKEFFFDNLEDVLFKIVDENFIGNTRKKYIRIASLMLEYLRKTEKFISKSDMYSWLRSYGIKNVEVREFIKEVSRHNENIFGILED
jgi:hypothetical protein